MNTVYSLMFAGVGGQGSLLMAELTSLAAVREGYEVKQSEVHGVSQRGGSVETHVRFGEKIHSPIITPGEAFAVIGLEKLEALRFAHFANPEFGTIFINDYEIIPGSVTGAAEIYPYDAIDRLRAKNFSVVVIPASEIAKDLGDGRMANVVMLGALSNILPIARDTWKAIIKVRIPKTYLEPNLLAFAAGQELTNELQTAKGE